MYRISGLTFLDQPIDLLCCSEKSLAFMAKSWWPSPWPWRLSPC